MGLLHIFSFVYSLTRCNKAANLADSSPATVPLPLRVEPKTKTGIRQQDLLKKVVEVKPKGRKVSTQATDNMPTENKVQVNTEDKNQPIIQTNPIKSLLAAYESSEDDED
ncbi:hypothetical protein R6Q57_013457 [Mikania cordata]